MDSGYLCGMYAIYTSKYLIEGHHFLFLFYYLPWKNSTKMIALHNLKKGEKDTCKYVGKPETAKITIQWEIILL
jgi:hypothetical protein